MTREKLIKMFQTVEYGSVVKCNGVDAVFQYTDRDELVKDCCKLNRNGFDTAPDTNNGFVIVTSAS